MTEGLCDLHSHILPGLDDGAQDMEETMEALKSAYAQGVRTIITTPHHYPERYESSRQAILETLETVRAQCHRANLEIRLLPGQECYYYSELPDKLDAGEVLTLADSRYVLVEFSPDCPYTQLYQGVTRLQQRGYLPILAHFERYRCLEQDAHLQEIHDHGILLQMNYDTFLYRRHSLWKSRWQKLVQSGSVDLLGSDCHGTHFRPCHIQDGVQWLEKHVREEWLEQMLLANTEKILRDTRWE